MQKNLQVVFISTEERKATWSQGISPELLGADINFLSSWGTINPSSRLVHLVLLLDGNHPYAISKKEVMPY